VLAVAGATEASANNVDIFLRTYDASTSSQTATIALGGPGHDGARGVAIDSRGDVLITGYYANQANLGDGTLTVYTDGTGFSDAFVAKYSAGARVWTHIAASNVNENRGRDLPAGIAVLGDDDPVVVASTESSRFTPDSSVAAVLTGQCCGPRYYVARYASATGSFKQWHMDPVLNRSYLLPSGIAVRNGSGIFGVVPQLRDNRDVVDVRSFGRLFP